MLDQSLDYYLADKPDADLGGKLIAEACRSLKYNRDEYLAQIGNETIISKLVETAALWQSPDYKLRKLALAADPKDTGFPREVLAAGLDACFKEWTQEKFFSLLNQEIGDPTRLQSYGSLSGRSLAMVHGPKLIAQLAPGNLPVPIFQSIAFGLLLRSAQFVKCATGKSLLPRLFGHSLHYVDPGLASALEIAEWKGGNEKLESELYNEADCILATGNDSTLESVRKYLPLNKKFIGYGNRISFGYVEQLANEVMGTQTIISRAADDVIAWNQQGCLSPQVIYIEELGNLKPDQFAEMLAEELANRNMTTPRGKISKKEDTNINNIRRFYKIRSENNVGAMLWESKDSTDWTVVQEDEKQFQSSPLNRFIFIKPIENPAEIMHILEPYRDNISTIGIAASEAKLREYAQAFGQWGVPRICPLGKMQLPPLTWRHDGRPPLGDLINWTDLEIN